MKRLLRTLGSLCAALVMVTKPYGEWTTTNGRELVGSAAVGGGEGCDDDMSASVGLMKKRMSP